jgi:hypothetical protein
MELLPNEKIGLGDFYLTYYGEVKQCKRIGDQIRGRVADWNGFTICKTGEQCYIKIKK